VRQGVASARGICLILRSQRRLLFGAPEVGSLGRRLVRVIGIRCDMEPRTDLSAGPLRRSSRRFIATQHRQAGAARTWGLSFLLPLSLNFSVALPLRRVVGRRRGTLLLYMSDFSGLALLCGSFALVWRLLRTGLVLGALLTSARQTRRAYVQSVWPPGRSSRRSAGPGRGGLKEHCD
jgi:hypothetical protein